MEGLHGWKAASLAALLEFAVEMLVLSQESSREYVCWVSERSYSTSTRLLGVEVWETAGAPVDG